MNESKNGLWVKQLTDEQIKSITKELAEATGSAKLNYVNKIDMFEDRIDVCFEIEKLHAYVRFVDRKISLYDFMVKNKNLDVYILAMAKIFKEEYINNFCQYADDYASNNPEDAHAQHLLKIKNKLEKKFKPEVNENTL